MPAPNKNQLQPIVEGLFSSAGLLGENAPDLASVVAEAIATALAQYLSMTTVQPGIAAAVDPVSGAGATTGPGSLFAPPTQSFALEPMISGLLQSNGIRGEAAGDLAKALAGTIGFGLEEFTNNVQVAPGIAIAGFATVAPGLLI